MQFTAKEISLLLNGSLEGNPEVKVFQLAKIEEAQEGALSFLANPKYEPFIYTTNASVVIVNEDLVLDKPITATLIRVKNAYSSFSVLLEKYNSIKLYKSGIEQPSFIDPTAKIGKDVYIGAFAYIGVGASVGDNTKIYPHCYIGDDVKIGNNSSIQSGVKIYHDCIIGNNVNIHANTVIGSDGFGFAPQTDGSFSKVSQIGNVIVEDNVEIGANTCIDRATMGSTIIKKGVKLDNLIQIAHNAEIGENTVIASQTGISGSAKIGESCIVGGQVGIVGHITLAKGTQIQAKSGINKSIEQEGKKWGGAPATTFNNYMRSQVVIQRLPDMEKKIEELQKALEKLQSKSS
ncbi:UDP-3-O-(3-hydroxymyristoyl)glucosamine N-acyltransferase [Pedobacter alpinus]|uniref:UDP-3-O-acylglucosamine N-acyltransferase n=1 Tax=Pedobacter alpinus TaxID=1590643 RepID=A0ABW5TQK4_9SPHI